MRQFDTLTGFLLSNASAPTTSDTVQVQGYAVIGDGGAAIWQHNGVTGQTISQSPIQLDDALLNDASGNQWAMVGDARYTFDTFANLELSAIGNIGQRFVVLDVGNEEYITEPSTYSKATGDATLASGLDASRQYNGVLTGSWTPVLSDGTNTATHSAQIGTYVKIGKMVHVRSRITTTSLTGSGTVSGGIRITGLPYNSDASGGYGVISVGSGSGFAITAGESITGFVNGTTDWIALKVWDSTAGTTDMQASEWTNDGDLIFGAIYYTA